MKHWLSRLEQLLTPTTLAVVSGLSLLFVVGSALGAVAFVSYIPEDYFVTDRPGPMRRLRQWAPLRYLLLLTLQQLVGGVLLLAGLAMLVLPGQGLLTIFAGLCVLEYPGKRRLVRRLVQRAPIKAALNGLRRRRGLSPLRFE